MPQHTRRDFLKKGTSAAVAAATVPSLKVSGFHLSNDETIQVALVGCGGRGGGAAVNAMRAKGGPLKLVAMADVFEDRQANCVKNLSDAVEESKGAMLMDVPADRRFVGFDGYMKAMDCLRPGDIVILTTPPAFRWVHFQYAISKKLNVFMEKPVTVDGLSSRKMLELSRLADTAGLKVGVGLMSRHQVPLQELYRKVKGGAIGDILLVRGYRMHGPAGYSHSVPKPTNLSEVEYQIRRFHSFLWASGGCFNDFYIHIIDHANWFKGAVPVSAQGMGAKHYKSSPEGEPYVDQNFDNYAVEYTYPDGSKFYFEGRCIEGANGVYSSYIHGSKGVAIASRANDCGGPSAIYKGQNFDDSKLVWKSTDTTNPYQNEWDALVAAIRTNKPYNEVPRGVEASVSSNMGRMAAHTAQVVTYDQMMNCEHAFAPHVDKMTLDGPAPVMADEHGRYPVPQPGVLIDREY
ncbi:MAG: Gfo/Idh/MocA family oxidoreductase [Chthonomonadaceae bacterium]|nr:Gfo/Idh/MocA family oxidoreductase [Chthonomonadaceae bacterium]